MAWGQAIKWKAIPQCRKCGRIIRSSVSREERICGLCYRKWRKELKTIVHEVLMTERKKPEEKRLRVTITVLPKLVKGLDMSIDNIKLRNRSQVVEIAITEYLKRKGKNERASTPGMVQ